MGAEFLVSRVRELHVHTLIRVIWEFPRFCPFVPLHLPSVIPNSPALSLEKTKTETQNETNKQKNITVENGGQERRGDFAVREVKENSLSVLSFLFSPALLIMAL